MSDNVTNIARMCHEVNRIYCESHGDLSQPKWENAPDWQIASARSGVIHLMTNRDAKPEDSHVNWLADKIADGWIYGETKDPDAKTHPCMVPYADLPSQQRHKDALFHAVVKGMTE